MPNSPVAILAIEPDLIVSEATDGEGGTGLRTRLKDYVDANLLQVVLLSGGDTDQIVAQLNQISFPLPAAIFDPQKQTVREWNGSSWATQESADDDSAEPFANWLNQRRSGDVRAVRFVSSEYSSFAMEAFDSVLLPCLDPNIANRLYQAHRHSGSLNRLYLSTKDSLEGVFEGLHWFDALPLGARENNRSKESQLGALSIKRDLARVAVQAWATSVDVIVNRNGWKRTIGMTRTEGRTFIADIDHFQPGDRYAFAVDGNHGKLYPDPRSQFQPAGVHGFSELTGPNVYPWRDQGWTGVSQEDLVIYELHIGTFTTSGTFQSMIEKLPELVELGVTAIELLPVAESAGRWNWGYDGVNLFAPYHPYGSPDDLKALVDQCHQLGLAIILDVVYNHPGPEGNYLAAFGPYFSKKHHTPWGPAYNFDGRDRELCRQWVSDNALYWLDEFHFDGLRLDAIHFMFDESEPSIVMEMSQRVRDFGHEKGRHYLLIGETNVFDDQMIKPASDGGLDFDAIWCDDMMHSIYSIGSPETKLTDRTYQQHDDVTEALQFGYLYRGPETTRVSRDESSAADRSHIPSMVVALQTHDSVGNQPLGKRLHQLTSIEFHQAAAALSLLYPAIPMLLMGDETLEPSPFHYFVDFHDPSLRDAIAKSRRNEHPQQNWEKTVSPMSDAAFEHSKLTSIGDSENKHQRRAMRNWYRQLLEIRRRWVADGLLRASQLNVRHWPESNLFCLSYEASDSIGSIAVRLSNPHEAGTEAIAISVMGEILADSSNENPSSIIMNLNHAIVVKGTIEVKN